MFSAMIEQKVKNLLEEIPKTNPFGEKITLVAAVKFQTPEDINRAIKAGIADIGDNHVQEFRDKFELIEGKPRRHFIGRLQTNKIKYLLGKCDLYQSVDRLSLAEKLSQMSANKDVVSNVLIEVNIGGESSKGGFPPQEAVKAYEQIKALPHLKVRGFMAMLPLDANEEQSICLARQMRALYDTVRAYDGDCTCLSMGMSGDWKICVEAGSNMIRLGTSIFGERKGSQK